MARGDTIVWDEEQRNKLKLLIAEGMSDREIAKVFGVVKGSISSARFRYGIASAHQGTIPNRPIPDDFEQLGPVSTIAHCSRHYRASKQTIRRWYRMTGLVPAKQMGRPKLQREPKPKKAFRLPGVPTPTFQIPLRPDTVAGSAQLYLQRFGPCFRACVVDPRAANDQWFVQGRRVSEEEMLSIAARKGFGRAA
jgi:hypothetical protein